MLLALVELLDRKGTGRLEQPETRFDATDICGNQRFCHQIGKAVYRIAGRLYCIENHGCGTLDCKAASKDAESPKEQLLVLVQQAIAPIDRRTQGLLSW